MNKQLAIFAATLVLSSSLTMPIYAATSSLSSVSSASSSVADSTAVVTATTSIPESETVSVTNKTNAPATDSSTTTPVESSSVQASTTTTDSKPVDTQDQLVVTSSDGFYVAIPFPLGVDKALVDSGELTFSLSLLDQDGKVLTTAKADKDSFVKNHFLIKFDVPEYKTGDKFRLQLDSTNALVDHLDVNQHTRIKVGQYANIEVIADSDDADSPVRLTGTEDAPVMALGVLPSDKALLKTVNESGNPISDVAINVKNDTKGTQTVLKTNTQGFVMVPTQENLTFSLADDSTYSFKNTSSGEINTYLTKTDKFQTVSIILQSETVIGEGNLVVSTGSNYNSDLGSAYSRFDLQLKSNDQIQTLTGLKFGDIAVNVPSGTFELSVINNPFADVQLASNSLTVNENDKVTLGATVTPKYILSVSKFDNNKKVPYNFKVINAKDKEKVYSGIEPLEFAVAPGQAILIQDVDTKKVTPVNIGPNPGVTRVLLGQGVLSGGTSPYTGDNLIALIIGLVLALLGLGFTSYKYNKKKKLQGTSDKNNNNNNRMSSVKEFIKSRFSAVKKVKLNKSRDSKLSIFLIGALLVSSFSMLTPSIAKGDIGGGSGGPITGGVSAMAGQLQPLSNGLVKVTGILKSQVNLSDTSTESDLASPEKFNAGEGTDLYFPVTYAIDTAWRNGELRKVEALDNGSIEWANAFDGSNTYNQESNDFKLNHRTMPVVGTDSSDALNVAMGAIAGQDITVDPYGLTLHESFGIGSDEAKQRAAVKSYLEKLEPIAGKTPRLTIEKYNNLVAAANRGELVLMFETVFGFYQVGGDRSVGYFTTAHDYLLLNELIAYTPWLDEYINQEGTVVSNKFISGCNGDNTVDSRGNAIQPDYNATCDSYAHPRFAGKKKMESVVKTARPIVSGVAENDSSNKFGGWGFLNTAVKLEDSPGTFVVFDCAEIDGEGKIVGNTFQTSPVGYTEADTGSHTLKDMRPVGGKKATLSGSGVFIVNGTKYNILADKNAPLTVYDKRDNEILDSGSTSVSQKAWTVNMGLYSSTAKDPVYLGWNLGSKEDASGNKSKYFGKTKEDGSPDYSDAKIVIQVKVMNSKNAPDSSDKVPQWRLSKYKDVIFEPAEEVNWQSASSTLDLTPDMPGSPSSLTPSGKVAFKPVSPNLDAEPWFRTVAKTIIPNENLRSITHSVPEAYIPIFGDLLSIKVNNGVDNLKTASWVGGNPLLTQYDIGSTLQGEQSTREPILTKTSTFKYGIFNPLKYIHQIGKYRIESWTDEKGGSHSYRVNYTVPEVPSQSTSTADYNISIDFKRFTPADTTPQTYEPVEVIKNGFASIAAQSPTSFFINPEVPMLYSDAYGNNSISFVAGDKLREIKPVSYSTITFKADVKPSVVSTAVVTDSRAQALAVRLSAGAKAVIYKGSGVNINFDPQGQSIFKSYVLDIGKTPQKNVWSPGTTYNANEIDKAFMSKFGNQNEGGLWNLSTKATESLKIADKVFGKNTTDVAFENTSNTAVAHILTVRGGRLTEVDGDSNYRTTLASTNPELLSALENMKLSTDTGVLSTLEVNKGDILTEEDFANLGNAVRGSSDLALNKGWYSEDSTVLVVREYTHTFKLPLAMFSDKAPMSVNSELDSPIDKSKLFSKGTTGHSILHLGVWSSQQSLSPYDSASGSKEAFMEYDGSVNNEFGKRSVDFIISNASVLDQAQ